MIIRQDGCGGWTITSGQVLQYGSVQELEIVLQDKDGRNIDPATYGETWALSLWTPSVSDPVELATASLEVDGMHMKGELDLTSEALYLYCAERCKSIVTLTLHSVTDPFEAALELSTKSLVQWDGDNHRVCPRPPCPCPPSPQPSPDVDTKIAEAMQKHEDDVNAHTNTLQPRIDADHKLPAAYVDGLEPPDITGAINAHDEDSDAHSGIMALKQDLIGPSSKLPAAYVDGLHPVATSGSYTQLSNLPDLSLYQLRSQAAQPGGYATLDANGKVPQEQLPKENVVTLVAATVSNPLSDGMYAHAPESAPVYVLSTPQDETVVHEITLDVVFSASALSVAFMDDHDVTVPVLSEITIAAGDVYRFLCFWSALQHAWKVMPTKIG